MFNHKFRNDKDYIEDFRDHSINNWENYAKKLSIK